MEKLLEILWLNSVVLTLVTLVEVVSLYGIAREIRKGMSILDKIEGRTSRIANALKVADN